MPFSQNHILTNRSIESLIFCDTYLLQLIRAEGTKLESDSGSSIAGLLEIAGAGGDRMEVLAEQIVFSRDFYKYFVNKRNILP